MAANQTQLDALLSANTTGGGVATGTITMSGVPTAGQTVIVNGITFTVASSPSGAYQFAPGASATAAATNLIAKLNAATDAELTVLNFSRSGAVITITYGTVGTAGNSVTIAGTYRIGVAATGSVNLTAGNAADGNTFVINGKTYTFQDTLTNSNGNVKIGGSATATIANLVAAITGGAGSGSAYAAATTTHTTVTAAVNGTTATVADITANTVGTGGNAYTLAKTGTNTAVSAATLSGGVAISGSRSGATLSGGSAGTGDWDPGVIVSAARMNSTFERGVLAVLAATCGIVELTADPSSDNDKARQQRRVLKDVLTKLAADLSVVANTTDDRTTVSGIVAEKTLKKLAGLNTVSTL